MAKDFFAVLALSRGVSAAEIRDRFRQLARERHPDKFQGEEREQAELDFQEITAAYNVLSNPQRRRQHEAELQRPASQGYDPGQLARVYLNRGIRAFKKENYIEAADNFHRAARTEPDNAQAWHHLALTCVKNPRWLKKGQDAVERALVLRPKDISYLKLAGKIFTRSGMTSRAKEYYNQALRLGSSDPVIRKSLAALEESGASSAKNKVSVKNQVQDQQSPKDKASRFKKLW
jgi:curved DNA-binding protein CbpA